MFQRDYIMRMIEQLGQALIRIMKLKEAEKFDAAQIEINRAGKMLLGFDMALLRMLSDEEIIKLLKPVEDLDTGKCIVTAELLLEDGNICERQEQAETAGISLVKSLSLFLEALLNSPQMRSPEYLGKVEELVGRLRAFHLPGHISGKLMQFYEVIGDFARAEDVLFDLADREHPGTAALGERFFERLLQQSDEALRAGNLPRDEVVEGYQVFKQKLADHDSG